MYAKVRTKINANLAKLPIRLRLKLVIEETNQSYEEQKELPSLKDRHHTVPAPGQTGEQLRGRS